MGRIADNLRQIATDKGIRPYRVFLTWTRWTGVERGQGDEVLIRRAEILPTPRVTSIDNQTNAAMHAGVMPVGSLRVDRISVVSFTRDVLMGKAFPGDAVTVHDPALPQGEACSYPGIPGRVPVGGAAGAGIRPPDPGPDMPPLPSGQAMVVVQGATRPVVYSPDPLPFGEDRREKHIPEPVDFYYEVVEDGRHDSPAKRMRFVPMGEPALRAGMVDWTITIERSSSDRTRQDKSAIGEGIE
jgi:hypothetical protein